MDQGTRRILLIDDSEHDRAAIKEALTSTLNLRLEFLEADRLDTGFEIFRQNQFDCVLLDHSFPVGSANDFLMRVKNAAFTGVPPPVVVVTGQGNEQIAVSAMKAGAFHYVSKDHLRSGGDAAKVVEEAIVENDRKKEISRIESQRDAALAEVKLSEATLAQVVLDLKRAKDQADSANLAKSAFLANMSHEIRTPLTAVIGFTELLLAHNTDEEKRLFLHKSILRNGQHLLGVINDILDFSKVEAGKIAMHNEAFDLSGVVSEVCEIFRAAITKKNIRLRLFINPELPMTVYSDPLRVRQILTNLLSNAFKFTSSGEISVVVQPILDAGKCVQSSIVVTDSGIGITSAEAKNLFTNFGQANDMIAGKYGGTGLGLVLSRKLAHLLGGDLQLVSSEPRVGSVFRLTLPITASDESAPSHLQAPDSANQNINLSGISLLVVDDSADNLYLISELLRQAGADVSCANGGKAALDTLRQKKFDVVIMDVQMPEMNGHQTARRMREDGFDMPVIGLTANVMPEDRVKSLAAGFVDQLAKPIDSKDLIATVFSIWKKQGDVLSAR